MKEYSADYYECIDDAKQELNSGARPELKNTLTALMNMKIYSYAVHAGGGTYPMAVFTQLERLDWNGKR